MIAISLDAQQRCSRQSGGRQDDVRLQPGRARHLPQSAREWRRLRSATAPLRRQPPPCWVGSAFRAPMEDEF
ncbi:hypothetical protein [Burkholderia sp. Ac-20379]|uniref:hypothetical protein n=1 Tax=Burkholderia sp. Ac-20379 TaxID=2703900 RepID=UPI00197D9590|nr:hypothetical protein [Burkholderia sp. Ac-20379]MBN3728849.1 hypothetical protein [Burkholderia sp. Ac-20379]